jgi:peroxiredoxin
LDALADALDEPTTTSLLGSSTMIEPGTPAPVFTRTDHLGRPLDTAALRGQRHLLLLFYPLDFTPT